MFRKNTCNGVLDNILCLLPNKFFIHFNPTGFWVKKLYLHSTQLQPKFNKFLNIYVIENIPVTVT